MCGGVNRTHVVVYFCAQAIGGGGGCANGVQYRSKTGARPWWYTDGAGGPWDRLPP